MSVRSGSRVLCSFLGVLAGALSVGFANPDSFPRGRRVPALVLFEGFERDLAAGRAKFRGRGKVPALIQGLRRGLEEAKNSLGPKLKTRASEVQDLWLAKALALELNRDEARSLAKTPGVQAVVLDQPVPQPKLMLAEDVKDEVEEFTYGARVMRIPEVHRRYGLRGEGIRIGVIDTGVDASHPDLEGRILAYRDFTSVHTQPRDESGHGTHVAGTLVGGNSSGVQLGIAPEAKLLVARALAGSSGKKELLEAMQWMLDPDQDPSTADQPEVVSMSWHVGIGDIEAFYRAIDTFVAAGIAPNFSAGNMGPDGGVTRPKKYPSSIAVGAVDDNDLVAEFSSRGPVTYKLQKLKKPEWVAPGVAVLSARPGGGYRYMNGTSMAAPHSAGVIALLRQANPDLSVDEIRQVLIATAEDLGDEGWDGKYGWGRIRALAAVEAVLPTGKFRHRLAFGQDLEGFPHWGQWIHLATGTRAPFQDVLEDGFRLRPGTHRLRYVAEGYEDFEVEVQVELGKTTSFEFQPQTKPWRTLSLEWLSRAGLRLGKGSIRVLDSRLPAISWGSRPPNQISLPPGRHRLWFDLEGHAPRGLVAPPELETLAVELRGNHGILFVDDDQGERFDRFYDEAFERAGRDYDYFDRTRAALEFDRLRQYPLVVWAFGNDARGTLTPYDQELVLKYLEAGGKILLSGQDFAYDHKKTDFLRKHLKTWFARDNSQSWEVQGLGLTVQIDGGEGAKNQDAPDEISPLWGSKRLLSYDGDPNRSAGIHYKEQFIVLGFGLEAVSSHQDRAELLHRLLAVLEGADPARVATSPRLRVRPKPSRPPAP